ncbi:uncharacterized protein LOC128993578 [Macrosteles quadrilineatus]|uniref:uncharacterized protein LOC128992175 n=1 Tax=Macrosteles quadrilineatus TaxID=74068 RepID=UPI0023E0BF45|nr:uncharacterized protein LOC128992175 [Macrosteles quadrilineatus]XP_054273529.1 uncharacterized protein LOC128993578 [Macrosteles quadrilineatus]XP_054273530.1 uncharacterized protein LOC128993578 [Macrosteles quadrilineatus]
MLSYHTRRLLYASLILLIIYSVVQIFRPPKLIDLQDREAQLKQMAKMIQSGSNSKLWRGGQACRHPRLEVNSSEIMRFIKPQGPLQCADEPDWVTMVGGMAKITQLARDRYGDIECSFTDITRTDDFYTRTGITTTTHTEFNLESSDVVRVRCISESGKKWNSILAGIRNDQDVMDRSGWQSLAPDALGLNVLMFGFDSLSRNTFIRKLPRSYAYLHDQLGATVLEGYNIVGDGTPQALIPILTGKTELELPDTRKRMGDKASFVNVYPFIWNDFAESGYVTAYMEDTPSNGIWTYRLKGFDSQPTDHYMRTFFVEAEGDYRKHKPYCIGSLPRHKIMMEYAKNMFVVYKDRPKFVFGFHGEISHDNYNLVGAADEDLLEWLQWFNNNGHLNNTMLIVMSDHGHRFAEIRNTQQGKLEERLPFFSFVLPPWMSQTHPRAVANLRTNKHRLTTPFDIHATLASLLHFPPTSTQGDLSHRSLSLFQEVPQERTCADAFIEPHWCACLEWEKVDPQSHLVHRAATTFVDFINQYNAKHSTLCSLLNLEAVLWSARLVPSRALRRFKDAADLDGFVPNFSSNTPVTMETYQIKLITQPGNAIFEASISHHLKEDTFSLRIEDVSRINMYGSAAACIENTQEQLRKFCHCKTKT